MIAPMDAKACSYFTVQQLVKFILSDELSAQPVLHAQALDALELADVVGDQSGVKGDRMRCDEHIVLSDGLASVFQISAQTGIGLVSADVQRGDSDPFQ